MEKKKTSKKTTTKPLKKEDTKTTKKVVKKTKKKKKIKGFTLVELLAVIVILAVVMLIAVTTVGPMMTKARKSSLGTEGLALIEAAESVYSAEQFKGASAEYTSTSSVCYTVKYLCENGYFEKGCNEDDGYTGSVLVEYKGSGSYNYTFWLSNGTYVFNAANKENYGDIENIAVIYDGTSASTDCGKTLPSDTTIPDEAKTANNNFITGYGSDTFKVCDSSCIDTTYESTSSVKTISFTINGTSYTANEGETWAGYISRTGNGDASNNGTVCISPNMRLALTNDRGNCPDTDCYAGDMARDIYKHDGSSVSFRDEIIANEEYATGGPT